MSLSLIWIKKIICEFYCNFKKIRFQKNDQASIDFDEICNSIKFKLKDLKEEHILKALEMAEKSLDETNRSFDSNTNKSTIIIGFLITFSLGLISYFFQHHTTQIVSKFSPFLFTILLISIFFSILAIYLSKNVKTKEWYKSGMTPSSFLHEKFLPKNEDSKDNFYKVILYNSLRNYERNIKSNENANAEVSQRINTVLYFTIRMPFISLIVYAFTSIINSLLLWC